MNRERLIETSAIFFGAENRQDTELVSALRERGIALEEAERLIAFLPIAFGRVVISELADVRFSGTYMTKENGREFEFSTEPIYRLAEDVAAESFASGGIERAVFAAVANRSAELAAVNRALNKGADLDGGEFQPVLFWGFKTLGNPGGFLQRIFG